MIALTLLLLGSLGPLATARGWTGVVEPRQAPVREQAAESARAVVLDVLSGRPSERAVLERAVAALDGEGLLALLRVLVQGRLALETGPGRARELVLGVTARGTLLDAVAAQPHAAWTVALDRLDPVWDGPGVQLVSLELLARGGTAADLSRLERATARLGQPATPELRSAARAAFERFLSLSGEQHLPRMWRELPGALLGALLDAYELALPERALDLFGDWLGLRPAADALLLERIERLLDPRHVGQRPFLVHEARRCLARSDASARRYAVLVLGALGDVEALEDLAPLLLTEDAETVSSVRASMRRLVGDDLGADPASWAAWLTAERGWRDERGPELAELLTGGSDAAAVEALRELGRHRIDRPWRARTAALALEREPADLLVLACGALERFGTGSEATALESLAAHPDARVSQAASRAARALAPQPAPEG